MNEIYVSTDVETDGPIPGPNSMLSFGSAAYTADKQLVGTFSALDIKSFAMAVLGTPFRQTVKRNMPKDWFDDLPHTHQALDDAKQQGAMFCNVLAASRQLRERSQ